MTFKQRLLKFLYPLLMKLTKASGKNSLILTNTNAEPMTSIYDLDVQLNNGKTISMSQFKGKKLLLVNTASNCGYTNQYDALQELYTRFSGKLEIIGFPANDFQEQEKGSDEEIGGSAQRRSKYCLPLAHPKRAEWMECSATLLEFFKVPVG